MGPANESRVVLIGTAIAIVVLLLFALSLGAVLLVSRMADPGGVPTPPSPITTLAPSPIAAQIDEPDSTQEQFTLTNRAATSTMSGPAKEPNTPPSTPTTRPVPPTATAPPPTVPIATLTPPPPPSTPAPAQPDGVVLAPHVNLRAGPGAEYPVLRQLAAHEPLHILGQAAHLNWLEVSLADGQHGWVSGDPNLVQLNRERAGIPAASFRPLTGLVHQDGELHGLGELQLASGAARDALVVVTRDEATDAPWTIAVYVRAGERYTLRGIPDGAYTVVTSQGDGWDGRGWIGDEQRNRVEQTVQFVTTDDAYSVWTINLVDAPTN